MARLITGTALGTTTITFLTSQTWTCPAGVVTLLTVVGKGQDGTPATGGGYGPATHHTAEVAVVQGVSDTLGSARLRFWSWGASQSDISAIRDQINVGGSGSYTSYSIDQYTDDYLKSTVTTTWTGAIPGSAATSVSARWKTSGNVVTTDFGVLTATWDELGTYSGGTAATTGSNTTGFSKTWNGGVGVGAVSTTYTNITVVPATGYPVVVPTGGYISITY
jgi:flagellar capping protein FliD